ncbi:MAG: exopolyphosphatase [Alphaproteobacteria bacterium]|nr:exopolyphosphatase [Alphaproteobacteria bacterium]MCB9692545.1 exopolyphosphatase [Alphaproteobacteria bacterium]
MRAAIDLGSNSALLTVMDGEHVVHDEARVVGLGRGVADGGPFRDDRMDAALAALADYAHTARSLGVDPADVVALTTSAARRATNAAVFFERVTEATGLRFRVISGDEEAARTFLGAASGLELDGRVLVVDLGGGSTELAMGVHIPDFRHSYEIGSVRLTEAVLGAEVRVAGPSDLIALRRRVDAALDTVDLPGQPDVVVGVAGSVTTLMATELGLAVFEPDAVHGRVLEDTVLAGMEAALLGLDAEGRRAMFPVSPARADYLLAACVVLRAVLARAGERGMVVSTRGLRFGALMDLPSVSDVHRML